MQAEFSFQPASATKLGDAFSSQASPDGEGIKAFRGQGSHIPASPAFDETVTPAGKMLKTKGLFSSPMPTPMSCAREDTLKTMVEQLEVRLATERQAQVAAKRSATEAPNAETRKALTEEADMRGARVFVLSQKLARTRRTLDSLRTAQKDYHSSAQKVQDAERKLQKAADSRRRTTAGTSRLRRELDDATSMMSAAFRRVEQIESITDQLITQLSEAEAELADLHAQRDEETAAHADEVSRLAAERSTLAANLEAAVKRAEDIEAKDETLQQELAVAAQAADELASKVEAADRAKTEVEERLSAERQRLAEELAVMRARETELATEIEAKEVQLTAAEEKALAGTPVGRGAKVVLPMALQRIKDTQNALKEQETLKATAERERMDLEEQLRSVEAEQETLQAAAEQERAALQQQLRDVEAERERQVAEKQASLDSMTRAAAMATKEAGVKQEAVNKLVAEVAALDSERQTLQGDLQTSTQHCLALESTLAELHTQLEEACGERQTALSAAEELKLELAAAELARTELAACLDANLQRCAALEASIEEMKGRMEADAAAAHAEAEELRSAAAGAQSTISSLKTRLSEALSGQTQARKACDRTAKQLHQQEEAALSLARQLTDARLAAADLVMAVDTAAEERTEMMRAAASIQNQLDTVLGDRDALQATLSARTEAVAQMESSVASLRVELKTTEAQFAAKTAELEKKVAAGEARLEAAMAQLTAAADSQDTLAHINDELMTSIDGLQDRVVGLSKEKAAALAMHASSVDTLCSQLQAASQAQTDLMAERSTLQECLAVQESSVGQLQLALQTRTAACANAEAKVVELQAKTDDRVAALSRQLQAVSDERDGMERERLRLQSDLDRLSEMLQEKENEVCAARVQGTPKGEASKQVLTKAFDKIRGLQAAVAAKAAAVAERDVAIADLQAVAKTREELAAKLQGRLKIATEAAEAAARVLKSELAAEKEARAEVERVNAELAPQVESLVSQLEGAAGLETALNSAEAGKAAAEAAVSQLQEQLEAVKSASAGELADTTARLDATVAARDALQAQKAEVEQEIAALRGELADAESLSLRKAAANKEFMVRCFKKIRDLDAALDAASREASELSGELECSQDNAAQLAADLAGKLMAMGEMKDDNAALERALCRLRLDVQSELYARQDAERQCDAAAAEIADLGEEMAAMRGEIACLKDFAMQQAQVIAFLESDLSESKDYGAKMAAEVAAAQAQLTQATAEAASKLQEKEQEVAALEATTLATTQRIQELEGQVAELSSAGAFNAHTITELQGQVNELNMFLSASEAALSTGQQQVKLATDEMEAVMSDNDELVAEMSALQAKAAEADSARALVAELTAALEMQKETVATAKQLGAARETELLRVLEQQKQAVAVAKEQGVAREADLLRALKDTREKTAVDLKDAGAQLTALKKAFQESLVKEAERVQALEAANEAKVMDLEKQVAALRRETANTEALQRANMELFAQVAEAQTERRDSVKLAAEVRRQAQAVQEARKAKKEVNGHKVTLVAVLACALALLFSSTSRNLSSDVRMK